MDKNIGQYKSDLFIANKLSNFSGESGVDTISNTINAKQKFQSDHTITLVKKRSQFEEEFIKYFLNNENKFILSNEFDNNNSINFLNDKEIALKEMILNDEIINEEEDEKSEGRGNFRNIKKVEQEMNKFNRIYKTNKVGKYLEQNVIKNYNEQYGDRVLFSKSDKKLLNLINKIKG